MDLTEPRIIYAFPRSETEEVRLAVKEFKERYYLDLRIWFQEPKSMEYKPTKKGICIALDQFSELRKGVERLAELTPRIPANSKTKAE